MTIYIDADGCPVMDEAIRAAQKNQIPVVLVCDEAHVIKKEGAKALQVAKGPESVDIALVNRIQKGDILITQDYGLAAMGLGKGAYALHQDGYEYTNENIEGLLLMRHEHQKMRLQGKRIKGSKKRQKEQDKHFETALMQLIERIK